MGPKLDVKVGDEVAVVNCRDVTAIVKVEAIEARGAIRAGNVLYRADGSSRSSGLFTSHLEIVTDKHRAAVADEEACARVRRSIDRFPDLRNHLPTGRTELLREVATHLEAALALLDGAK